MERLQLYPFSFIGALRRAHELNAGQIMKAVMGNVGNLAFQYPLPEVLRHDLVPWPGFDRVGDLTNAGLVVTAANWISRKGEGNVPEELVNLFERAGRAAIFGLGAQAELDDEPEDFAAAMDQRLAGRLRRIGASVTEIGVRDLFTKEVLQRIGVENARVLGCISFFCVRSHDVGARAARKCQEALSELGRVRRVTFNDCTLHPSMLSKRRADLAAAIHFMEQHNAHYVLQGRHTLPIYLNETRTLPDLISAGLPQEMQDKLLQVLDRRTYLWTSVDDWISYYRTRDLVVGSRIHGAILSIQAGTPTVLIAHDSRTRGLADVFGLPTITDTEFNSGNLRLDDYLQVSYDKLKTFDANRKRLAREWIRYFQTQDFQLSRHLDSIACLNADASADAESVFGPSGTGE